MEKVVFKRSSLDITNRILRAIKQYKETNNLRLYDFLHSNQYEKILQANSKNIKYEGKEPYYGFSKQTATQTMSRILNGNGKLTDEVVKLIAENMNSSYSELVWGITEEGMSQLNYLYFNYFIIDVFYDALLSEKYRLKIVNLLKDYIPFTKYLFENNILFEPDSKKLYGKLTSEEFDGIMSNAVKRFLMMAENNFRIEDTSFLEFYIRYFKANDTSLKNISKTIEEFFNLCYTEYFEFVVYEYGDRYGVSAYELLQNSVGLTFTEYEMINHSLDEESNLLSKRIDEDDEEWVLKKQLVILTLNYVDSLANYQKQIEEIIFRPI